jgi:RNA polymerase sigma factor (sigma-70 family)
MYDIPFLDGYARLPRFSKEEEAALIARRDAGDDEAFKLLAESVLPWALVCVRKASRYHRIRGVEEMLTIAHDAVMNAASSVKAEKGRLTTYTYYAVQTTIYNFLERTCRHSCQQMSDSMWEKIPEDRACHEDLIIKEEWDRYRMEMVEPLLADLPERQRHILLEYMEIGTLEEVGEKEGISKERVRQIKRSALRKLRGEPDPKPKWKGRKKKRVRIQVLSNKE